MYSNKDYEFVVSLDAETGDTKWERKFPRRIWPEMDSIRLNYTRGPNATPLIVEDRDSFKVSELYFKSKLRGSCWTLIRLGEFIYGSAGGHDVSLLTSFHWRTGRIGWQERGFNMAQCLYADGKLIILDEDGKLTLATITPEKFQVLAQTQLTEKVSWTLPTLVSNRLYVRDTKHILALDLGKTIGR